MCCWMIDSFGSEEQRQRWLPDMCTMEVRFIVSMISALIAFRNLVLTA